MKERTSEMSLNRKASKWIATIGTVCVTLGCGQSAPPSPPAPVLAPAPMPAPEVPAAPASSAAPAPVAPASDGEFNTPMRTQGAACFVYTEGGSDQNHWIPSGYMGDVAAIAADFECRVRPFRGLTCMKWSYDTTKRQEGWCGVMWQDPENNWAGETPGAGLNLEGARFLRFAARGETGREVITVGFGGLRGKFSDTAKKELKDIRLTTEWKEYEIPLEGLDMRRVQFGFSWVMGGAWLDAVKPSPAVVYLDEVRYEF